MAPAITTETVEQIAVHSSIDWTLVEGDGYVWVLVTDDHQWAISIRKHEPMIIAFPSAGDVELAGVCGDDDIETQIGLIGLVTQDPKAFVEFVESRGDADIQHVIDNFGTDGNGYGRADS